MEITLKVTPQEVNIIGNALAQMPFQMVAAVIPKLKAQVDAQTQGGNYANNAEL